MIVMNPLKKKRKPDPAVVVPRPTTVTHVRASDAKLTGGTTVTRPKGFVSKSTLDGVFNPRQQPRVQPAHKRVIPTPPDAPQAAGPQPTSPKGCGYDPNLSLSGLAAQGVYAGLSKMAQIGGGVTYEDFKQGD